MVVMEQLHLMGRTDWCVRVVRSTPWWCSSSRSAMRGCQRGIAYLTSLQDSLDNNVTGQRYFVLLFVFCSLVKCQNYKVRHGRLRPIHTSTTTHLRLSSIQIDLKAYCSWTQSTMLWQKRVWSRKLSVPSFIFSIFIVNCFIYLTYVRQYVTYHVGIRYDCGNNRQCSIFILFYVCSEQTSRSHVVGCFYTAHPPFLQFQQVVHCILSFFFILAFKKILY